MKVLPWMLVVLLIIAGICILNRSDQSLPDRVIRDTVTVIDTIRDTIPEPYKVTVTRMDTFYLPILVGDSSSVDSVFVTLPIEEKEYKTDQYRVVISGFNPNLDFIETYNQSRTITVTSKCKRWGLGVQVGYGYPSGVYVGIGVSYNLWQW